MIKKYTKAVFARVSLLPIIFLFPVFVGNFSSLTNQVNLTGQTLSVHKSALGAAKILGPELASVEYKPSTVGVTVPIFMYHHVGDLPQNPDALRRDLTVSTQNFTQQVEWLKSAGYHSVSLEQLYQSTQGKFELPKKPMVFTFDDGYEDVFLNAVPVLIKNGFIGSFGIVTTFPGQPDYASWNEILAAKNAGMEIVSHTQDHFDGSNVRKYNSEFIYNNLSGSRKDLLDHGVTTEILIYPFGHSTPAYIEQAQKAGFVMGLTVRFGKNVDKNDLMYVPRVRVHGQETLLRFQDILFGRIRI